MPCPETARHCRSSHHDHGRRKAGSSTYCSYRFSYLYELALTLGTATLAPSGTAAINATLPVGSDIIVATYSGDVNDLGSVSTPLVLPIQIATTQVVLSSANPALVDSAITFTAAVRGDGPVATGIVTLFSNQSPIVTATLDGLGTAVLKTSGSTTGTHIITAVYSEMPTMLPVPLWRSARWSLLFQPQQCLGYRYPAAIRKSPWSRR